MVALFLSSFVSFYLFLVFGIFMARILKLHSGHVDKFFFGLLAVNTIVSLGSIFFPVNFDFLIVLMIVSLLLGFVCLQDMLKVITSLFKTHRYTVVFSIPFILIAFIVALNYPITYDTGMYHIQMIKWIEEYAAVPGLANLHGRFGFNSNIFTVFALTSFTEMFDQEIFSINFTTMAVLIVFFIHRLIKVYRESGFTGFWLFYLIVFVVILRLPNLSGPSPDFLATAIPFFIFIRILEISKNRNSYLGDYAFIFLLSIYLLTIKLAAVPIAFLFVFVIIKYRSEIVKYLWLIPVAMIIFLPWFIRNIVLTGWLIYPFPALDLFSFDWQVPVERVIDEKNAVTGWGRMPGPQFMLAAEMSIVEWFPQWWRELGIINQLLLILSIASPFIFLLFQIYKRRWFSYGINAVVFSSFSGIIFWLFMAPDWRFGEVFVMTAGLSPLLWLNIKWKPVNSPNLGVGMILMGLYCVLVIGKLNTLQTVATDLYLTGGLRPLKIQIPESIEFCFISIDGEKIYFPENTIEDRCFDHDLPCTPFPDPTLEFRGKTLGAGFRPGTLRPYQNFKISLSDK